jgi:hypothetical protein
LVESILKNQWILILYNFINHLHPNFEMISWISQFAKYLFEFPLGWKWSLKIYFSGFVHLSQSCFVTYSNPMH